MQQAIDRTTPEDGPSRRPATGRSFPILRLLLYYVALVAVAIAAGVILRDAPLTSPAPAASASETPRHLRDSAAVATVVSVTDMVDRSAIALLGMMWALAMSLPVAWALKHTRKLSYDPSLVHTLIILPIVVSGIVFVVRNSLALAFALAGIVAGVRFRQKLDEPEQAVYVLLALGIGLAAGVQAIDVALVMSLMFTLVVLALWRFDVGDIFSGGRGAQLSMGDPRLLRAPNVIGADSKEIAAARAAGIKAAGLLIVRTGNPDAARRGLEVVLGRMADHWRFGEPVHDTAWGPARIDIPLELKGKQDPAELIAELDARLSDCISAAEYIPLGSTVESD